MVTVISAKDLPPADILGTAVGGGLADPIVRLSMIPDVPGIGNQSQRTSRLVRTLNPEWKPPQYFHFIVVDDSSKILLSVYVYHISE